MDEALRSSAIVVAALVVDCKDPSVVAAFWAGLLGGEVVPFDEFGVVAVRAPGVTFDFVSVEEPKVVKNRWHLDLATADPGGMIDRATALGARRASEGGPSDRFTVMVDVEDNEFCILHDPIEGAWVPQP